MAHRQRGPRNDVFVGNIARPAAEDIRRIFSEVGRVKNVRMAVNPRQKAARLLLRKYDDAATALSAIETLTRGRGGPARELLEQLSIGRLRVAGWRRRRRRLAAARDRYSARLRTGGWDVEGEAAGRGRRGDAW